jgi:hypothetical protein
MDPATSALTLFGAALSTIKILERLRDARDYPKECSAIFAEASDLKSTLQRCLLVVQHDKSIAARFEAFGFTDLARAANDELLALSEQLRAGTFPAGVGSVKELRAFWTAIVRGKDRASASRDQLQRINAKITTSLAALTA